MSTVIPVPSSKIPYESHVPAAVQMSSKISILMFFSTIQLYWSSKSYQERATRTASTTAKRLEKKKAERYDASYPYQARAAFRL